MEISRRCLLHPLVIGLFGLSGCETPVEEHLRIINQSSDTVTATISVVRLSDEKQLLKDTFTLPVHHPDDPGSKSYNDVIHADRVRVHLVVENGPEASHEYVDANESDADDVTIVIHDDQIVFRPESPTL